MRKILFLMTVIILGSCESEVDSYPIVYNFNKQEITESTMYTVDNSGNDVFPAEISPFTQTGVSQIEFFEQLSPDFPISKITLLDETKLEVEFDQNVLVQKSIEVAYSKNQEYLIPEFGIVLDGDGVYGQACLSLNAQTAPYLPEFTIDFCNDNSAVEASKSIFNERMYGVGDTLALSLQRFTFVQE